MVWRGCSGFEEKKRAFLSDDEARSLRKPKDEAHAESREQPAQLPAQQQRPAPSSLPPTPPTGTTTRAQLHLQLSSAAHTTVAPRVIVRCSDLPVSTIDEILSYPEVPPCPPPLAPPT